MRERCAHCHSRRRRLRHRSYITGRRYCSARCQRLALRAQQREIGRILRECASGRSA